MPVSSALDKFRRVLEEMFMFDQADLDFGLYRILRARREEFRSFINNDLLPQVRESLAETQTGDYADLQKQLAEAVKQAQALGVDAELTPRVVELRAKVAQAADPAGLEAEVFSHLTTFFSRYYDDGDYISLRRYKKDVYAIPYEGEEMKLYWANSDQYYTKSSEYFRDYTFELPDGRRVHFKLAEADTEQNNNKAQSGQDRRFQLRQADSVADQANELIIYFVYTPDPENQKQDEHNRAAAKRLAQILLPAW
jgi:adenine-specific DNA-methyltransferase